MAPTLDPAELAKIDPAAAEIVPRMVAQIANEMTFALEERVGSPDDMNTAMKLGFNWPLGPVEFAEMIGVERAVDLLEQLQGRQRRRLPAGARPVRRRPRGLRLSRPRAGR